MLAVQDFRHASQKDEETVADFICRLERHFRVAYGRDAEMVWVAKLEMHYYIVSFRRN